ncbi:hypothetical protein OG555_26990 [Kribbella sp. NBC_01484]|uniref:hypothetical protein n=1 Tax=Kribbella sp. NBC_01484 TaxID=2903579 RepID=UPI002E337DD8|nr:hypothetical protein [Kribbella sp. NBC_01484]
MLSEDRAEHDLPPAGFAAMKFVEDAMRQGFAVQITALRHELPIDEAAGVVGMGADELRRYAAQDAIPVRASEYTDWVRFTDVLALDERLRVQRREALDAMLAESDYDELP